MLAATRNAGRQERFSLGRVILLVATLAYCVLATIYFGAAGAGVPGPAVVLLIAALWATWLGLVYVSLVLRGNSPRSQLWIPMLGGVGVVLSVLLYVIA